MQRVTGIGGIFFKSPNAAALREWYQRHLGIPVEAWGGASFQWQSEGNPSGEGSTIWSVFEESNTYFEPSPARFMINYRVADLDALLAVLREEDCDVVTKTEDSDFGKFGWVMDPDGNRVELWQPPS
jgi:predicted enzyme related to lactoylglutathione lyase